MSLKRILIADDDENVVGYLNQMLKKMGYEVTGTAANSEAAIAKTEETLPDLILMDALLAGRLDGIDTAAQIHNRKNIPIIYLADQGTVLDMQRVLATTPFGYLRQPFDEDITQVVIEMALRQHDLEQQVRESEERYQMLVREAADGIFTADGQGKLILANEAACNLVGYSLDELLGRNFQELLAAEEGERGSPLLEKLAQGNTVIQEGFAIHKDGKRVEIELHSKKLSNGYIQSVVRNITRRKRIEKELRESERRYRQLFETMHDGLAVVDLNLNYLECNQAFLDITGYEKTEDILHKSAREITPPEYYFVEQRILEEQVLVRGYCDIFEKEYIRKDGSRVAVSMRGWLRRDDEGRPDGVWWIVRDISFHKEAMSALRESERHYHELFDTMREGIAVTDMQSRILDCNPAFLNMLGYASLDEMRNKHLSEIVPPEYVEGEKAILQEQVLIFGYSEEYEKEYFRKDGTRIPVNMSLWLRRDSEGQPVGVWAIARDITLQKQIEEAFRFSEIRYRSLFTQMMDGFGLHEIICDEDGKPVDYRFLEVNPALEKIIGIQAGELVGKTVLQVLPLTEPVWIERYGRVALNGTPTHFNDYHQELGKYFEVAAFCPRIGQFAVIVVDVSERVEMQQALEAERSSLARRVEERTADLRIANVELAKAARMKDEFLANMSHELRTPLTGILGMSEALHHLVYGPMNEKQLLALHNIEDSGTHLLALINDILDLSKVEAGKMELDIRPVSLDTVCQASQRLVKQSAMKKQLKLTTSCASDIGFIMADEKRLKQIIVNLLGNAVKFTPEGGSIGIDIRGDHAAGLIFITVWDTGIGIDKEDMLHLFAPFTQLDSTLSRQYGGTGLGLSLVLRLVELHGGSISVESSPGAGSRFTVSLPWNEVVSLYEKDALHQPAISVPAIRQALVVEDTPADIEILTRYLKENRVEDIHICTQASQVLPRAEELQPDIILLDLLLPEMSGLAILKILKTNPKTSAIPVIVVSVVDEKKMGIALGAADYLIKPVTSAQIRDSIRQIFTQSLPNKALLVQPGAEQGMVLLVEDNPINLTTIADFLQVKGYTVHTAVNGLEAIEKTLAVRPDIILMDIQMPMMDGLEATRRIRSDPQIAGTPIVAITALAMSGDRERCFEAGVNEYLSKPLRLDQLQEVINGLMTHPTRGQ